ncbi:hypothetical protein CAMRE0001_2957 [Campylobacter rectus RM3267]|uniref:Uncharacterized protein n=1 Tax=Campylobacter rectus RM3267 TaxID=553218 RepID=B9D2B3_CAMRE|nr:hypothetical protein CAMRE0001_2957 [Campylobacter rectus RM3267]
MRFWRYRLRGLVALRILLVCGIGFDFIVSFAFYRAEAA